MATPSSNINYRGISHSLAPGTRVNSPSRSAHNLRPKLRQVHQELYGIYLQPGITIREVRMLIADKREVLTGGDMQDNDDLAMDIMDRVGKGPPQLQQPLTAMIPVICRTLRGGHR